MEPIQKGETMKYAILLAAGLGMATGAVATRSLFKPGLPYYAISAGILITSSGYAAGSIIGALRRAERKDS